MANPLIITIKTLELEWAQVNYSEENINDTQQSRKNEESEEK